MSVPAFEAFNDELLTLKDSIAAFEKKTVRGEAIRERFRTLFRTWRSVVRPGVEGLLETKRELYKLEAEIESLAKLTSKIKPVAEYRKRLGRAISLAEHLVLYLPPTRHAVPPGRVATKEDLFTPGIPDLPTRLVPNSLIGWRREIEAFATKHPFDKSVFIMIRYRQRNASLIAQIRSTLSENGYDAILASEHSITNDLYNPVACLFCCSKGIAVFDQAEVGQDFNPNVAYELGIIHLLGREVLILKHESLQYLHSDILMRLYVEYGSPSSAGTQVGKWLCPE